MPSSQPSTTPSLQSLTNPTSHPGAAPTALPTSLPSSAPSRQPNVLPSTSPSSQPTDIPSYQPSNQPSIQPTKQPSGQPTHRPSPHPLPDGVTRSPTLASLEPTLLPTRSSAISVIFEGNATEFKIELPFMFTNPVSSNGKSDVFVPHSNVAESLLVFGNKHDSSMTYVGSNFLHISPAISYDFTGRSVSNAGDVNGDGRDDLIIGVPYTSRCHVLFGTAEGFVNMTEGFRIVGADSSDLTGWSVSGAGDINNDTFADILIGAPSAGLSQAGAVYVLYGSKFPRDIDLSQLSAEDGFLVRGATEQDSLGIAVSGTGDVDDDGFDDIIIGALRMSEFFSRGVYVIFGSQTKRSNAIYLHELFASNGFFIEGPAWSWFGYAVSRANDFNGDGVDDMLIGSVPRKFSQGTSISYIIFGKRSGLFVTSVESIPNSQGVKFVGGGVVVSGVGDVNGDGLDDILIVDKVDFSSGGGILMRTLSQFPQLTAYPSFRPSLLPSVIPTKIPTVIPSVAPTGPTFSPSMVPTQPTSVPSARPTAPSLIPSISPTLYPSIAPTVVPTFKPSLTPSKSPTLLPTIITTFTPSTRCPSMTPTVVATNMPTRYPVVRPSMMPSNYSEPPAANITYNIVNVKQGGQYTRTRNNTHYVVNSTSDVMIVGGGGIVMYTVIPNKNTTLRITYFDVTTDVINLEAFSHIHSINQLQHDIERGRSLGENLSNFSVSIILDKGQNILIANISRYDLDEDNFIFAKEQSIPAIGRMERSYGPLIVLFSVFGSLALYLMYKCGEQLREHFRIKRLLARVTDWDSDNVRENPTYISFNVNDSDRSIFSDISKESEDDYSDITSESKDSTMYESPRHSAVGESKSDSESISIGSFLSHTKSVNSETLTSQKIVRNEYDGVVRQFGYSIHPKLFEDKLRYAAGGERIHYQYRSEVCDERSSEWTLKDKSLPQSQQHSEHLQQRVYQDETITNGAYRQNFYTHNPSQFSAHNDAYHRDNEVYYSEKAVQMYGCYENNSQENSQTRQSSQYVMSQQQEEQLVMYHNRQQSSQQEFSVLNEYEFDYDEEWGGYRENDE